MAVSGQQAHLTVGFEVNSETIAIPLYLVGPIPRRRRACGQLRKARLDARRHGVGEEVVLAEFHAPLGRALQNRHKWSCALDYACAPDGLHHALGPHSSSRESNRRHDLRSMGLPKLVGSLGS